MGFYDHTPDQPAPPKASQGGSGTQPTQNGGASGTQPQPFNPNQRFDDFSNRMMNNFLLNMGDPIVSGVGKGASWIEKSLGFEPSDAAKAAANLPALRLQRAQMNQRMPTTDKAAADYLGQFNPTMLLRGIPAVGPIAQGAVQEGVKGYAQGESWPQIQKDAVIGATGGAGSNMTRTPEALGTTLGKGVTVGIPAGIGWIYGGKLDDTLQGMGGPGGAVGGALFGNQFLDPWAKSWEQVGGLFPPKATEAGSWAPLAAASYYNQDQRDRATLAGQQP